MMLSIFLYMLLAIYVPTLLLGRDVRVELLSHRARISSILVDNIELYFRVL